MLHAFIHMGLFKKRPLMITVILLMAFASFIIMGLDAVSEGSILIFDMMAIYAAFITAYYRDRKRDRRQMTLYRSLPVDPKDIVYGTFADNISFSVLWLGIAFLLSLCFSLTLGKLPHIESFVMGLLIVGITESLMLPTEFLRNSKVDSLYVFVWIMICVLPGILTRTFGEHTASVVTSLIRPKIGLLLISASIFAVLFLISTTLTRRFCFRDVD
ncbi:MAG: ABC-2 transporter permease [Filifactor alocis]|nr:ABC-2 transporter permease [Filifactor alocis]